MTVHDIRMTYHVIVSFLPEEQSNDVSAKRSISVAPFLEMNNYQQLRKQYNVNQVWAHRPETRKTWIVIRNCLCMYQNTMLQKLSKCEVNAWLCQNLIILPPLRFYVKSNLGEFKRSTIVIFGKFRDSEVWILVNLGLEICSNLLEIKIQNL